MKFLRLFKTLKFILAHPLARHRPMAALGRYARWQVESRLRQSVEFKWVAGSRLLARHGMAGATGNIYCGLHEFADMAFLLHLLRPGDLFVDVGANIGSYSILASAACGARVIAAEPDPFTMRDLRANVEANQASGRVELIEAALGAHAGGVAFTVGLDTVNHVGLGGALGTREVPLRTLDDVVGARHPMLIKMDVEGYEAQVLAGAGHVLSEPSLRAIITEGVGEDVRGPLEAHGFQEFSYEPFTRTLSRGGAGVTLGPLNGLFIRDADFVAQRVASAQTRLIAGVPV